MKVIDYLELALTAWFAYRLVRSPQDRGLRVIVIALLAMLLGEGFVIAALRVLSAELITPGLGKVVQNCSLAVGFCAVMVFFLLSASGTRFDSGLHKQRLPARVWWESAVVLVVCAVLAVAMARTPAPLQEGAYPSSGRLQDAALGRPEVVAFYLVAVGYFAYAATCSAVWAARYGRESSVRARIGLWMAAAGMVLFGVASACRGLYVGLRGLGMTAPAPVTNVATVLIDLGATLWIAGLLAVGIAARGAALRVRLRHRRAFHALRPLWEPLHAGRSRRTRWTTTPGANPGGCGATGSPPASCTGSTGAGRWNAGTGFRSFRPGCATSVTAARTHRASRRPRCAAPCGCASAGTRPPRTRRCWSPRWLPRTRRWTATWPSSSGSPRPCPSRNERFRCSDSSPQVKCW